MPARFSVTLATNGIPNTDAPRELTPWFFEHPQSPLETIKIWAVPRGEALEIMRHIGT